MHKQAPQRIRLAQISLRVHWQSSVLRLPSTVTPFTHFSLLSSSFLIQSFHTFRRTFGGDEWITKKTKEQPWWRIVSIPLNYSIIQLYDESNKYQKLSYGCLWWLSRNYTLIFQDNCRALESPVDYKIISFELKVIKKMRRFVSYTSQNEWRSFVWFAYFGFFSKLTTSTNDINADANKIS